MKKVVFPVLLMLVFLFLISFKGTNKPTYLYLNRSIMQEKTLNQTPPDSIKEIDLTIQFQKINAKKEWAPLSNFRKGNVTKNDLIKEVKSTANGFIIDLGSFTNVPTPSVHDGKLFVSGGFGSKQYYSFDAKTGKKIWSVDLDDDGPSSGAIKDSILVFNTESCTIFACNIYTGEQLWSYYLGDPLMSMPTISKDKVFTAYPAAFGNYNQIHQQENLNVQQNINPIKTKTGKFNADTTITIHPTHAFISFDLKTGKILWQKWIDGDVMSAPVADGNYLYVTTFRGTLFKFNQETGEILSAKGMRATSAPVLTSNGVIVSKRADNGNERVSEALVVIGYGTTNNIKQFQKRDAPYLDKSVQAKSNLKSVASSMDAGNGFTGGAPENSGWQSANDNIGQSNVSTLQSFQGSRTLNYSNQNYNTMGNELICSDPATGKTKWNVKLDGDLNDAGGFLGTPPISAGNSIIVATFKGEILVMDAQTGKVNEQFNTHENIRYQPVVADGWIYVTSTSGKLIAINTKNKNITGWPQWGGNAERTNKSK